MPSEMEVIKFFVRSVTEMIQLMHVCIVFVVRLFILLSTKSNRHPRMHTTRDSLSVLKSFTQEGSSFVMLMS